MNCTVNTDSYLRSLTILEIDLISYLATGLGWVFFKVINEISSDLIIYFKSLLFMLYSLDNLCNFVSQCFHLWIPSPS